MSSSEVRIIKYAKISSEPVVIAMQEFRELDVSALDAVDISEETDVSDGVEATEQEVTEDISVVEVCEPIIPVDEAIIQAAREEAQAIRDAALSEVEKARAKATEEGRRQGYEIGLNQGKKEGLQQGLDEAMGRMSDDLRQAADKANALISEASKEAELMLLEAEPKIIELILAISRKVICDEFADRPTVILNLVHSALERVKNQDRINIHVSPDDYEQVLSARRDLQVLVGAEKALSITADTVLTRGGCLIETSFGTVEAGVDSQLELIRKTLQELLP